MKLMLSILGVILSSQAYAADFTAVSSSVSQPAIQGGESLSFQVAFKNTSSSKASLSNPAIPSPFLVVLNRCVSVGAGKNCAVTVSLNSKSLPGTPAGIPFSGNLISANADAVTLSTSIIRALPTQTESSFSFVGEQSLNLVANSKSSIIEIKVKNSSSVSGKPSVSLTSNPSSLLVVLDRCVSNLRPDQECSVYLSFGRRAGSNSLKVANNLGQGPVLPINITVEGGVAPTPVPATPTPVPPTPTPEPTPQVSYSYFWKDPIDPGLPACSQPQEVSGTLACKDDLSGSEVSVSLCSGPTGQAPVTTFMSSIDGSVNEDVYVNGNLAGNRIGSCPAGQTQYTYSVSCFENQYYFDNGFAGCEYRPPVNYTITLVQGEFGTLSGSSGEHSEGTFHTFMWEAPANMQESDYSLNLSGCDGQAGNSCYINSLNSNASIVASVSCADSAKTYDADAQNCVAPAPKMLTINSNAYDIEIEVNGERCSAAYNEFNKTCSFSVEEKSVVKIVGRHSYQAVFKGWRTQNNDWLAQQCSTKTAGEVCTVTMPAYNASTASYQLDPINGSDENVTRYQNWVDASPIVGETRVVGNSAIYQGSDGELKRLLVTETAPGEFTGSINGYDLWPGTAATTRSVPTLFRNVRDKVCFMAKISSNTYRYRCVDENFVLDQGQTSYLDSVIAKGAIVYNNIYFVNNSGTLVGAFIDPLAPPVSGASVGANANLNDAVLVGKMLYVRESSSSQTIRVINMETKSIVESVTFTGLGSYSAIGEGSLLVSSNQGLTLIKPNAASTAISSSVVSSTKSTASLVSSFDNMAVSTNSLGVTIHKISADGTYSFDFRSSPGSNYQSYIQNHIVFAQTTEESPLKSFDIDSSVVGLIYPKSGMAPVVVPYSSPGDTVQITFAEDDYGYVNMNMKGNSGTEYSPGPEFNSYMQSLIPMKNGRLLFVPTTGSGGDWFVY